MPNSMDGISAVVVMKLTLVRSVSETHNALQLKV